MSHAPIIVTVYDRLQHFQQCIGALQRNGPACESELYVVSDAPGRPEHAARIDQVRAYARAITGFKNVHLIFREENYGVSRNFLAIAKRVMDAHGRFIFLEDDVVASPNFLDYMNDGLSFYEADKRVFSITAYTHPIEFPKSLERDVFFLPNSCLWGFATWKDRWENVDFSVKDRYAAAIADPRLYKKIVSMGYYLMQLLLSDSQGRMQAPDIRMAFHQFANDVYSVCPRSSKTLNIGLDGSGQHSGTDVNNKYLVHPDTSTDKVVFDANVRLDSAIIRRIRNFQNGNPLRCLVIYLSLAKRRWMYKSARKHAIKGLR
jgi:hypothetical protein